MIGNIIVYRVSNRIGSARLKLRTGRRGSKVPPCRHDEGCSCRRCSNPSHSCHCRCARDLLGCSNTCQGHSCTLTTTGAQHVAQALIWGCSRTASECTGCLHRADNKLRQLCLPGKRIRRTVTAATAHRSHSKRSFGTDRCSSAGRSEPSCAACKHNRQGIAVVQPACHAVVQQACHARELGRTKWNNCDCLPSLVHCNFVIEPTTYCRCFRHLLGSACRTSSASSCRRVATCGARLVTM